MMFNVLSLAFHIVSLMLSNILTIILLKYQSSILYINRTILNYLNMALIITMNISVNEQSIHSIFRVVFGPFSQEYAFCARAVLVLCFFTFNLIFFTLNIFRIVLISKVCVGLIILTFFYLHFP